MKSSASFSQTGLWALKSASIPPLVISLSVNAVITRIRAPADVASFTAFVWVIDLLTGARTTSALFIASATESGGSCPSISRGLIIISTGSASIS